MYRKTDRPLILWYHQINIKDIDLVGGKNASIGEMINNLSLIGINIPNGYVTTSYAFNDFLSQDGMNHDIYDILEKNDLNKIDNLRRISEQICQWIINKPLPKKLEIEIYKAYKSIIINDTEASFAIRSSANTEDLPDASFAGQQETYLNIKNINSILISIKKVYASLFSMRAISYRIHKGYNHRNVTLSVGIQRMVRSDLACSGVMFTIDTESGFDKVVFITAALGLGEMVVQGAVNTDEFYVYKPALVSNKKSIIRRIMGSKKVRMIYSDCLQKDKQTVYVEEVPKSERNKFCLNDTELQILARQAILIEQHYKRPMDIEWAKDGKTGKLFVLQARPETVCFNANNNIIEQYVLQEKSQLLVTGRAIGNKIGSGTAKVIFDINKINLIQEKDVLITDMTGPDWEPIMKKVSAIVTNRGGRTCHAAIIARELGIPAIVGCGNATDAIKNNSIITVSCNEGEIGNVYNSALKFTINNLRINHMPKLPLKIMMNIGNPDRAFHFASLPNEGVGLARLEFIINSMIGIHPKALLEFNKQTLEIKKQISIIIQPFNEDPVEYYVSRLTEGIATLGAAFFPKKVIIRFSDFKTNEYVNLIGGNNYEIKEENPMLGFRGASRYLDDRFRDCFALECQAIKKVRNEVGLTNIEIMIPFVRTVEQAQSIIQELSNQGLNRGENGLKIFMMCEIPSNALLAEQFLQYFDGFSIGSNDMTQLTLGIDRDSNMLSSLFNEFDDSLKILLSMAIDAAKKQNKYIGICGQGISDNPDFAVWLMEKGVDSLSLNPDNILESWLKIAKLNNYLKIGD
ncbi:phosphoenolpyruvate synthase [Candidatus Pantoea edessiphila]|uniref:Phosphoenolpyruvate synthase n=1 Tax=Candidatus Pantoea edessiphila TaxID=2044610 RepID=A0A2P5SWT7_9GAMM|nr:phosphoenolpyruvate synthase [Candidatus Pantoea edessiphila]PPI86807.1 phosphoenolpyruvate synthase [Candidatus Pantoea edessiphila]